MKTFWPNTTSAKKIYWALDNGLLQRADFSTICRWFKWTLDETDQDHWTTFIDKMDTKFGPNWFIEEETRYIYFTKQAS